MRKVIVVSMAVMLLAMCVSAQPAEEKRIPRYCQFDRTVDLIGIDVPPVLPKGGEPDKRAPRWSEWDHSFDQFGLDFPSPASEDGEWGGYGSTQMSEIRTFVPVPDKDKGGGGIDQYMIYIRSFGAHKYDRDSFSRGR